MMNTRRRSDAALKFAERRQREQDAQRLRESIPTLATLRLDITEGRGETNADPKHSRIIMVDTAPALFSLACADRACKEGGHDLTHTMLQHLRHGDTSFVIEDTCYGNVSAATCGRTMKVQVTATYSGPKI